MERVLNDQQLVRRQKMDELKQNGINPFGNAFIRNATSKSIKEEYASLLKEAYSSLMDLLVAFLINALPNG